MKDIDFLPQVFHAAMRRRRQFRRNSVYALALIGAMSVLHSVSTARLRTAEAALAIVQTGDAERLALQARIDGLEARCQTLRKQVGLLAVLDDDAPLDAILGEITRRMTRSMSLRGLTLQSVRAALATEVPAGTTPAQKGTELTIRAVAASDVEVGVFFGKLSSCPLFDEVRLSYSKEVEFQGRLMREFELKLVVRPVQL